MCASDTTIQEVSRTNFSSNSSKELKPLSNNILGDAKNEKIEGIKHEVIGLVLI